MPGRQRLLPEQTLGWSELHWRRRIRSRDAAAIGSAKLRPISAVGCYQRAQSNGNQAECAHGRIVPHGRPTPALTYSQRRSPVVPDETIGPDWMARVDLACGAGNPARSRLSAGRKSRLKDGCRDDWQPHVLQRTIWTCYQRAFGGHNSYKGAASARSSPRPSSKPLRNQQRYRTCSRRKRPSRTHEHCGNRNAASRVPSR
jgi:hypothetical protein